MKGFVKVASLSDMAEDTAKMVTVGHAQVCLARSQGEIFAVADECTHAEVSLADGDVEHGTVECWLHGSKFDLRTGRPTGLPATEPVDVFPVQIDGDDVYVAVKE
jgi:nitrite reductase/ring-hydroxylating ferredoxin subunit